MFRKKPYADLKVSYPIFFEIGVIIALLLLIVTMKFEIPTTQKIQLHYVESEGLALILPPSTAHTPKLVPPPPLPDIPIQIPDDSPIEPDEIEFNEFELFTEIERPRLEQEIEIVVDYERLQAIEVLPKMIGGEKAFRKSIEYPRFARMSGIEGLVEVEFTVSKKGKVLDPVIVRGIGGGCDKAVLQAIKLQRYSPGVKDGLLSEFRIKETVQFIILSKSS